ncbi:HAMP domain-containing sensor histidine kinase [Rhizobium sp. L1K21]|uniref:sensor histidine kinase n=1 Tax=Rhizobium sp. L1K21 TaxID=2954933 RepID=UPI0020931181|nr:HAMP domain-containing sensor histidine kinase [Rhizobium sp. L1K21]MCO6186677.1 HAMP domain-containing histidine kinase [Rhizobium sp. L1K21]
MTEEPTEKRRTQSLTGRVLVFGTVWAVLALLVIGIVISTIYRRDVEKGFRELLRAQLFNVVNSISVSPDGVLIGTPQMGDLRFSQPNSGWYWVAQPVGEFGARALSSSSLAERALPPMPESQVPFSTAYERSYEMVDGAGNDVQVLELEVVLDDQGHIVRFRVAGNRDVVAESVNAFLQKLTLALFIFGIGSIGFNAIAILLGLKPLDKARDALEKIRGGEAERLEGNFPREIEPLANEVNAMIDNNRRVVERARMQVGNLAHSLKTPIAVLLNEARVMDKGHGALVAAQAEAMQNQVQAYLNRARIAAERGTVLARTEPEPVLERLVRVMRKLNREIAFELDIADAGIVLAVEAQDLEEIMGNLLENAARFARSGVWVSVNAVAAPQDEKKGRNNWVRITVEDDGPGLTAEQMKEAMKRGRRLDESKPGSGLGLSIVKEVASEYEGRFRLANSHRGGLAAELVLPAVMIERR